jgi:hypothetical protein
MALLVVAVLAITVLPVRPAAANGQPTVTAGGPFAYTEQDSPVTIGTGTTVADGGFYDGGYIEFEPDDSNGAETLSLETDDDPDTTNGAISIVGSSVYLGDGSEADVVGTVDVIRDGQDGAPLRINFATEFSNAGFERGDLTTWSAGNQRVDLGVTAITPCVATDTSTYPGLVPNQDNNVPMALGTYSTRVVTTGDPTEGIYALEMESVGITTAQGFDVVHGPVVYSSSFEATAGDTISFDWRAFSGADAYHVFGYIVDSSCNQTEVLDAVGDSDSATTEWATKQTVIPDTGSYRFVFVAGTYDFSGGQAAGARLLIDNVRVAGSTVTDAMAQEVARRLRYENSADNPPASQTVTVSARNKDGETGSDQITVNITGVDDGPPVLDPIAPATLTNTDDGAETFANETGTLTVTDPDDDPVGYDIVGSEAANEDIGGTTYTRAVQGAYGTLYVKDDTGDFVYVPDDEAINARSIAGDVDEFDLTATAAGVTVQQRLTIQIDVEESVPGEPAGVTPTPGNGQVALSWAEPSWLGGSPITGYVVEYSIDGGTNWTVATADTGSSDTSYTVTGLQNGVETSLRVSAINATGTGDVSDVVLETPRRSGGGGPLPEPPAEGPVDEVSDDAPAGGVVTTDPGGQGPTQEHPVTGAVRTPGGGTVSIAITQLRSDDSIHGLKAFGRSIDVEAPNASRQAPLRVSLTIDASELPGTDEGRALVLKDGEPVTASCRGDVAIPDPCIHTRSVEDGDLVVEVLTSTGGRFAFTEPTRACPRSLTTSGRFDDVSSTHAGAIDCISTWRPSLGYGDQTYRDEAAMTRGQLASIVASSLEAGGIALPDSPDPAFGDLQGSVHAQAIRQLAELGLVNGINEDTFAPNRRLTRAQVAAILVRIAEQLGDTSLSGGQRGRFSDISGSVHRDEILKAADAGFTNGFGDGTFRPGATVTRGQGATFVVRMLDGMVRDRTLNLPL